MIVTKKFISRRGVLRGIGAAVALPFLDAMVPAFASEAPKAKRIGFVYLPNGVAKNFTGIDYWTPKQVGRLTLDAKAFRILSDIPPPGGVADPRTADITVRDLLYHAGGWNRRAVGDGGDRDHWVGHDDSDAAAVARHLITGKASGIQSRSSAISSSS